jgi:hypothetical protein
MFRVGIAFPTDLHRQIGKVGSFVPTGVVNCPVMQPPSNLFPTGLRAMADLSSLSSASAIAQLQVADRTEPAALMVKLGKMVLTARRHALSAVGPIGVSGAHFVASLLLLRSLPSAEFGQFSFAIVAMALCLSVTNGLLVAPISSMPHPLSSAHSTDMGACLKSAIVFTIVLVLIVFVLMASSGASAGSSVAFGAYGGTMALRLTARTYAYTHRRVRSVVLSDGIYSLSLLSGLMVLVAVHWVFLLPLSLVMMLAACCALIPFGRDFFGPLFEAIRTESLRTYGRIWRDMTRWSLAGVVTTEVTINAHAYLVTFICGSKAFALLAVGSLFMRPYSVVAAALPDQERPAMARSIAGGDPSRALRIAREFRVVIAGMWLPTLFAAGAILHWYPMLVTKKGYDKSDVIIVVAFWALITAVRGIRSADAVLLQAAREFRTLADAAAKSSIVTLVATLLLLLAFGPIASLGGILVGDVVMLVSIMVAVRRWRIRVCDAFEASDVGTQCGTRLDSPACADAI